MNIIAVDDELSALRSLERALKIAAPAESMKGFLFADDALAYAKEDTVDVAFLDIEMSDIDGISLAKQLRSINSATNVIFVTGYSHYMSDAFGMHASGYLMKPIDAEGVAHELENLRHPVKRECKGLRVQCFGNFEVFLDEQILRFPHAKSKEAFAYLVDRKGAAVSKKELAAVLLEDDQYSRGIQSYIHRIASGMLRALEEADAGGVIVKRRNLYAVDPTLFSCDYYEYEKGVLPGLNRYRGEYMSNYSWAEMTLARLTKE